MATQKQTPKKKAPAKGKPKAAKKPAPAPSRIGRPTDYDPSYCDIAASACARGATIAELADMFGVVRFSIYRWMAEHDAFGLAVKVGRERANDRVGFSLYERAVGYTYDSVKIMQYEGAPVIVPFKEHVPPDVGAAKFWLTNQQPKEWSESQRIEHTGKDGGPIEVDNISDMAGARMVAFALGRVMERQRALKAAAADAE